MKTTVAARFATHSEMPMKKLMINGALLAAALAVAAAVTPLKAATNNALATERDAAADVPTAITTTQAPMAGAALAPDAVDAVIAARAAGLEVVEHVRVVDAGQIQEADLRGLAILWTEASIEDDGNFLVFGALPDGRPVVADVRVLEADDTVHVIRDIYLDGDPDFSGRAAPVPLTVEAAGPRLKSLVVSPLATTPVTLSGATVSASGVSNGLVAQTCGRTYDGGRAVNNVASVFPWTIAGSGFGSTRGTLTVAGRTATISSWTDSKIVAYPTAPYTTGPMSTTFTIRTAAGTSRSYGVGIVPAILSRIAGQCTHTVAKTRIELGLSPSPSAYGGYSPISGAWVPRAGDQLKFGADQHTAIIIGVAKSISGATTTYTLTVKEANARCDNAVRTYTGTFVVKATSSGNVVVTYPRASVSNLPAAVYYYR